ncbi:MAG: hypothetical protein MR613_02320 [Prevotella sp.]|nr:hypothetical protein [Prevotella sp.]
MSHQHRCSAIIIGSLSSLFRLHRCSAIIIGSPSSLFHHHRCSAHIDVFETGYAFLGVGFR